MAMSANIARSDIRGATITTKVTASPTRMLPMTVPQKLPTPPTTMTTKAGMMIARPMSGFTPWRGASRTPAIPAKVEPML